MAQGSTDADVAAALGVGSSDEPDEGSNDEVGEDSHESQGSLNDLPEWAQNRFAEVEREVATLRRENAQRRLSARDSARRSTSTNGDGDDSSDPANARALTAAEKRGRESAQLEFGMRLAQAKIEAALAGTLADDQIADVVEDINLSRFVDDTGEVDLEAVRVLKDKYTNILGKKPTPKIGHGQRGNGTVTQKTTADQFADALGSAFGG